MLSDYLLLHSCEKGFRSDDCNWNTKNSVLIREAAIVDNRITTVVHSKSAWVASIKCFLKVFSDGEVRIVRRLTNLRFVSDLRRGLWDGRRRSLRSVHFCYNLLQGRQVSLRTFSFSPRLLIQRNKLAFGVFAQTIPTDINFAASKAAAKLTVRKCVSTFFFGSPPPKEKTLKGQQRTDEWPLFLFESYQSRGRGFSCWRRTWEVALFFALPWVGFGDFLWNGEKAALVEKSLQKL